MDESKIYLTIWGSYSIINHSETGALACNLACLLSNLPISTLLLQERSILLQCVNQHEEFIDKERSKVVSYATARSH